jgi:hypothetical protein
MKFYKLLKSNGTEKRSSNKRHLEKQKENGDEIKEIDEKKIDNESSMWWHKKRKK